MEKSAIIVSCTITLKAMQKSWLRRVVAPLRSIQQGWSYDDVVTAFVAAGVMVTVLEAGGATPKDRALLGQKSPPPKRVLGDET